MNKSNESGFRTRQRREKVAHIRLSKDEFSALKAAARRTGMTVSAFVRSLALEGAGEKPFLGPSDKAIIQLLDRDLRTIGGNLNDLARALNTSRSIIEVDLAAAVRDARAVATTVAVELALMTKNAAAKRRGEVAG